MNVGGELNRWEYPEKVWEDWEQCNPMGQILKVLCNKICLQKYPQNNGDFLGYFEKEHFM